MSIFLNVEKLLVSIGLTNTAQTALLTGNTDSRLKMRLSNTYVGEGHRTFGELTLLTLNTRSWFGMARQEQGGLRNELGRRSRLD